MAGIIISKTTAGLNNGENALIGKLAEPLKMYLTSESDAMAKKDGPAKWLCNAEPSDRFAEAGVVSARPSGLELTQDGDEAPLGERHETDKSVIYMLQYMRQEKIHASMVEDSMGKVSGEMKRTVRSLVNDYYVTRNRLAGKMLTDATKIETTFGKKRLTIAAPGGHPLFYKSHEIGSEGDVQSNIFYNTRGAGTDVDFSYIQNVMNDAVVRLSGIKASDGNVTGYTADTIVIPGDNAKLITAVKKAVGSELTDTSNGSSNGINIHAGNWNIIILNDWRPGSGRAPMIFLSSEARDELGGNMLYTRKKLTVADWIENGTFNYCWAARARLGIGHHTYKHALLFESLANGETALYDGQTASAAATSVTL